MYLLSSKSNVHFKFPIKSETDGTLQEVHCSTPVSRLNQLRLTSERAFDRRAWGLGERWLLVPKAQTKTLKTELEAARSYDKRRKILPRGNEL